MFVSVCISAYMYVGMSVGMYVCVRCMCDVWGYMCIGVSMQACM